MNEEELKQKEADLAKREEELRKREEDARKLSEIVKQEYEARLEKQKQEYEARLEERENVIKQLAGGGSPAMPSPFEELNERREKQKNA